MLVDKLVIDGLLYRQVCICIKQPCVICFCLFTLNIREINEMLNTNIYKCSIPRIMHGEAKR
jgi:hypothetical protein